MTDSKLTEIVQLPLGSLEMQLVAASMRYSLASVMGDISDQLTIRSELIRIFREITPAGYNAIQHKIIRLSQTGFSDVEVILEQDPTGACTHCRCDDKQCCWCGKEKS